MPVEPEPQPHPGAGSTHQSDQRLLSSTDHFAVANYAADDDNDSDLLGNAANINSDAKPSVKPAYRQHSDAPGPADISQSPDDGPVQPG